MPRVVGIDHLVLSVVGDLARSKDFYGKVLASSASSSNTTMPT
jgi:predicted enzyme related to lactoylglutathione lyase